LAGRHWLLDSHAFILIFHYWLPLYCFHYSSPFFTISLRFIFSLPFHLFSFSSFSSLIFSSFIDYFLSSDALANFFAFLSINIFTILFIFTLVDFASQYSFSFFRILLLLLRRHWYYADTLIIFTPHYRRLLLFFITGWLSSPFHFHITLSSFTLSPRFE
jgi:hypothetical protein